MSHGDAMCAGRVVMLARLAIMLALNPMVVSARRAVAESSAEATGEMAWSWRKKWMKRLLLSFDYRSNATDLEPGAVMLSSEGLYAYAGDGPGVLSAACTRPDKGFSRIQWEAGMSDSDRPCNSSMFLNLYTMRLYDEGYGRIPDDLLSDSPSLLQQATLELEGWDPELDKYGAVRCFGIQGCSDKACSEGLRSLKVCAPDIMLLRAIYTLMDGAVMDCTNVKQLFPSEVVHAVHDALQVDPTTMDEGRMPSSFCPYAVPGNKTATQELLEKVLNSFSEGIIAHEPGKNSRSGAIFFYSQDRNFMAKRIRRPEMKALWKLTCDRSLAERSAVLSPIYLAFKSERTSDTYDDHESDIKSMDNWVVMRTERLGPEIDTLLSGFDRVEKFFYDLKPEPMESDRLKALHEFDVEYQRDGFRGSDLPGWKALLSNVAEETQYLNSRSLVDYSAFMYGAHFDVYNTTDYAKKIESMNALVSPQIGCSFGCRESREFGNSSLHNWLPSRPLADRHFIDVTSRLYPTTGQLHIAQPGGQPETYACCCFAFPTGTSHSIYSPCVLVSLKTPGYRMKQNCGGWLESGWHGYQYKDRLPVTDGKCIVSYEGQPWSPNSKLSDRGKMLVDKGYLLKPGPTFNLEPVPSLMAKCAVACVSLADYLLEFSFYKQLENVALLPWYGELKWTRYDEKFNGMIDCYSSPGVSGCGSFDEKELREIDIQVISRLQDSVLEAQT